MGLPSVKSFFGLDLSTGTFIIAGISLGGNILCFLFFIYTLVAGLRLMVVNYEEGLKPVVITVSWSLGKHSEKNTGLFGNFSQHVWGRGVFPIPKTIVILNIALKTIKSL